MYSVETIIYFLIFLILISMVIIANQIKKRFSHDVIKNYSIAAIIVALVPFIVLLVIFIMHYLVKNLFSISDGYDAANLTSSVVMAAATVIYVMFTYFILDATNKNTQQSALSIQQTAKSQKIAYLERKLELFYLPMENALIRFDIKETVKMIDRMEKEKTTKYMPELADFLCYFKTDYDKVIPFTYLSSEKVRNPLKELIKIFESSKLFIPDWDVNAPKEKKLANGQLLYAANNLQNVIIPNKENISKYYTEVKKEVVDEIDSLREQLSQLLNL